jgi:hypothetical protein
MNDAMRTAETKTGSARAANDRFPHVRERLMRLIDRDESFRDLCEEYEVCAETVVRLASGGVESAGIRMEYGALLLRLERELLRYLEEHPDRGDR